MTSTIARPDADGTARDTRTSRRRIPTLLLVTAVVLSVLAAFAVYALVVRHDPVYRSSGAVVFDQPEKLARSTNPGVIDKLSRLRATYIGIARSDAVLDAVAEEVDLTRTQVANRTFTSADEASLLLVVGAQSGDAQSARRIATALANQLVTVTEQQQTVAGIADADRVVASVVIEPRNADQVSPTPRRGVTAGVVTGLLTLIGVLGLGIMLRRPTG